MSNKRSVVRQALRFRVGVVEPEEVPPDALERPRSSKELLWIDIEGSADEPDAWRPLAEALGLEHVAEALPTDGRPMVRFRDDALLVQVRAIVRPGGSVDSVPLLLVAAPNMVLSIHRERIGHLEGPVRVFAADPRFGRLEAGTFAGLLMDGVIDGYFGEVEEIEKVIDELDTRALADPDLEPLLGELVRVRGRIATLRRTIAPHRQVFAALAQPPEDMGERSSIGWPWAGLPGRLDHALEAAENAREQLVGTFDLVMTRTGEHTNDVMRILTVISAVLLPSVVIAGVMGMNFKAPLFDDPGNFPVVVAAMLGLAVAILLFARWRRWV